MNTENSFEVRDQAAKAQHGGAVRRIMVDGHEEGELVVAYAKFPDVSTMSQVTKLMKQDEVAALDQLFNKCVLKDFSDAIIFSDDELRWAVMQALPELVSKKKGTLVKL